MRLTAERLQLILTTMCGFFLLLTLLSMIPGWFVGQPEQWAIPSVACGAYFALGAAWRSLKGKSLDVNLLMLIAAVGAVVVGRIEDAAVLLFLFSLGSALEAMAMGKTQSAIEALVKLRPDQAILVEAGTDRTVPIEELKVGNQVRVLPFEPIPTDGKLVSASAGIDESALTGESVSVSKVAGDSVMAGTQNLDSMLLMEVTHAVGDSSLDKIVTLVREAQENQATGERISNWFGQYYTVFVIVAFALSLGIRMALSQPYADAFYASLILLVALSPCALVISSPAASLSALAFAARKGALIRGGEYLEKAGHITVVAMDKTGTLTLGRPQVAEICIGSPALVSTAGPDCAGITCWHPNEDLRADSREALRLAAAAEAYSTHPIAEAIVNQARALSIDIPEATSHQAHAGLGVEAVIGEKLVRIGQLKFFANDELPLDFEDHVNEIRSRGMTAVLMKADGQWAAIGLRDAVRSESPQLIEDLKKAGIKKLALLTGDNDVTAQAVAKQVGITDVRSALMPQDKLKFAEEWRKQGEHVMMVGDGINDAPALTAADLGIAMGSLGSEAALRAADIVLVQDRLQLIPTLIKLGRMTNAIIRANLVFAAGVVVTLTTLSFVIKLPLPIAVLGHEGSTVLVILNGLRLLRGPK
ncbi:MAG: cation-translocating P-type ATPase [Chthonomonas sp.]|nr:cation-translocating P-type ATPase [Chthonomonas sp.]